MLVKSATKQNFRTIRPLELVKSLLHMASIPLYDTFFIILPRKVHYLFSYFEKSGEKVGHPQKSCLTPPLRGGGSALIFVRTQF